MKKTLHLVALFSVAGLGVYGQDFIQVTQSDLQHQIKVSQNQALEVRLPSTPSTGFGWYSKDNNANVLKQVGNWEFISDNPAKSVGASGTQVYHYVSTAAGTTDLELLYKRPWEDASKATASYKVTIVSEGAYTGKEVQPYIAATAKSNTDEKVETPLGLPTAFSWLSEGIMTPVKNQKQCGSCWAFATCGIFESEIKFWDNVTRDFSEQWLVNCTQGMDCGGGMFPGDMFTTTGGVYEPDQAYTGANGSCKSSYTYHEKAASYQEVANTQATIKQAIYDYGPVWVGIDAGNNFQNYSGGVFTQSDGTALDHAVVLCGWDDATSSWVLRNSWGTSWGENSGYMRIKYGVSGVGANPTYFNYKGIINHNTTGISDLSLTSARVFPNPSNGVFTFSGLENENTIQVYDYVGNLVYQTTSKNSSVAVDLKEKSQGVYMYKVINTSTKGTKAGKLIVY